MLLILFKINIDILFRLLKLMIVINDNVNQQNVMINYVLLVIVII